MSAEIGGPYVSLACFCERVLEEKDGVSSLIRLIDRLTIQAGQGAPEEMPPVAINAILVLRMFSGLARGMSNFRLTLVSPSGIEMQHAEFSLLFEGDDRAAQAKLNMSFIAPEQGLYWVNVTLEGQTLTRVPLRLMWQRIVM